MLPKRRTFEKRNVIGNHKKKNKFEIMNIDINTFLITIFSSTAIAAGVAYVLKKSYDKLLDYKVSAQVEKLKNQMSLNTAKEIESLKNELRSKAEKELIEFKNKIELENSKVLSNYNYEIAQKGNFEFEKFKRDQELEFQRSQEIFENQLIAYSQIITHIYRVRNFFKEIILIIESSNFSKDEIVERIKIIVRSSNIEYLDFAEIRKVFKEQTDELLYKHRLIVGEVLFSILHDFKHLNSSQHMLLEHLISLYEGNTHKEQLEKIENEFKDTFKRMDDMYNQTIQLVQQRFNIE